MEQEVIEKIIEDNTVIMEVHKEVKGICNEKKEFSKDTQIIRLQSTVQRISFKKENETQIYVQC
jgi:ribosomal protein L14E/L6E/L27E